MHSLLKEALRADLIAQHKRTMEQLDLKYNKYISQLLLQKAYIVMKIQQQFFYQLNMITFILNNMQTVQTTTRIPSLLCSRNAPYSSQTTTINSPPIKNEIIANVENKTAASLESSDNKQQNENQNQTFIRSLHNHQNVQNTKSASITLKDCYIDEITSINDLFIHKNNIPKTSSINNGQMQYKCSSSYQSNQCNSTYKCNYYGCAKTFSRKEKLILHIRTHNAVRPFTCGYCRKSFTKKNNLLQHMHSMHIGYKPYMLTYSQTPD